MKGASARAAAALAAARAAALVAVAAAWGFMHTSDSRVQQKRKTKANEINTQQTPLCVLSMPVHSK